MAIIRRNKSTIYGLNEHLATLATNIQDEAATRAANDGDLAELETLQKDSLVAAINEAFNTANAGGEAALLKAANLEDLESAEEARGHLSVYSTEEVDQAIEMAGLALGTNYTVQDVAERDALEDLDAGDRVFVRDAGEGTWVLYKPVSFDEETGLATDWMVLYSQEALEQSATAEGIKEAYESNEDTNAFTDAEKEKLGLISATEEVDLDDVVLKAGLVQDLNELVEDDQVASAKAVKDYAAAAVEAGASIHKLEAVVISGDLISLQYIPKDGLSSIMNFATVRYTDGDGVAWDAPVVATDNPGEFNVLADEPGQWDGETVMVQYIHSGEETTASEGMSGGGDGEDDGDQGELPEPD